MEIQLGCTVCQEYNYDTIRQSHIEIVNSNSIRGYRISDGWLKGVHVFFYAEFSKPVSVLQIYENKQLLAGSKELTGRDIRLLLQFENKDGSPLIARVGISPVSMEGAKRNLQAEVNSWDFDQEKGKGSAGMGKRIVCLPDC